MSSARFTIASILNLINTSSESRTSSSPTANAGTLSSAPRSAGERSTRQRLFDCWAAALGQEGLERWKRLATMSLATTSKTPTSPTHAEKVLAVSESTPPSYQFRQALYPTVESLDRPIETLLAELEQRLTRKDEPHVRRSLRRRIDNLHLSPAAWMERERREDGLWFASSEAVFARRHSMEDEAYSEQWRALSRHND